MTVITGRQPAGGQFSASRRSHAARVVRAAAPGGRLPGGTAVIRIRLLGRFAVEHDGQEIALGSFGGRLARRLLRLLALRRGTLVPKDLIADALWPDDPPADPAGNIEVLVSRIRRAMGDRALIRTGPGRVCPRRRRPLLGRRRGVPRRGAGRPGRAGGTAGRGPRVVPRRARHLARRAASGGHLRRLGASRPAASLAGLPGGAGRSRDRRPGEHRRRRGRRRRPPGPGRRWRPSRCASPRCCCWSARSPLPVTGPGRWPPSTSTGTVWPPRPDWSPRRRPARSASAYWQASRQAVSRSPPGRGPPGRTGPVPAAGPVPRPRGGVRGDRGRGGRPRSPGRAGHRAERHRQVRAAGGGGAAGGRARAGRAGVRPGPRRGVVAGGPAAPPGRQRCCRTPAAVLAEPEASALRRGGARPRGAARHRRRRPG